jgi:hypothetical protein
MGIDVVVLSRFLLTGIALLLAFLAAVTWNRRQDAPEATTFAVLVASMAVYSFGYAGELAQTTVAGALHWLDVEYLAVPWAGGLWVLAACKHNGIKGRTPLLFVIPALTFVSHFLNPWLRVTISVGVASHSEGGEATPEWLLKRADLALYRAKALGRDRVEAG